MIDWDEPLQTSAGLPLRFLTKRKVDEGDPHNCSVVCLVTKEDGLEFVYCCGEDGQTSNSNLYGIAQNVPKTPIDWNKPIETLLHNIECKLHDSYRGKESGRMFYVLFTIMNNIVLGQVIVNEYGFDKDNLPIVRNRV